MKHLPGVINPSDDLTKPVSWALHGRHAPRAMGHHASTSGTLDEAPSVIPAAKPGRALEAGEGVGA